MIWTERANAIFCLPYAIYLETRGSDAWYYHKESAVCLGREMSRADAKEACEKHAAKVAKEAA